MSPSRSFAGLTAGVVGYRGGIEWDQTRPDGTFEKLLDVSRINDLGWKATTHLRTELDTYRWFGEPPVITAVGNAVRPAHPPHPGGGVGQRTGGRSGHRGGHPLDTAVRAAAGAVGHAVAVVGDSYAAGRLNRVVPALLAQRPGWSVANCPARIRLLRRRPRRRVHLAGRPALAARPDTVLLVGGIDDGGYLAPAISPKVRSTRSTR